MASPSFQTGDKVFAKVRGYPPWPAKVLNYIDEGPNRQKIQVYFYGTRETAICKPEEIFDYLAYREKYGKPLKRKFFAEAINEIEAELEPPLRKGGVPTVTVAPLTPQVSIAGDKDSDDEGNLVIDESPSQKPKPKPDAGKQQLKRKLSAGSIEMADSPVEITSRSGRKIKPKKFLDAEPTETYNTPVTNKANRTKSTRDSVGSEENKIKKSGDQPETPNNTACKVELRWDGTQNVKNLLNKSENSDLPKGVKKDFRKSLKKRVEETKPNQVYADNENLEFIKIEVQLLDADYRIKSSLNLLSADCEECLHAMDEILELKVNALMLKKHPEVVDTVKKLRKYVGNISAWKLTPEQVSAFNEGAAKIRSKADYIYNKFRNLFTIPNGKTFFEIYSDEVSKFQEKTSNLPVNQVYQLIKEPSE